jgi:hypothetical protein
LKSKLLLYGAIGVGGYLLFKAYQKAAAGRNLQYGVKRINFKGSSLTESNLDLTFDVLNTSSEDLTFNKFFGTLKYNGDIVAMINLDGAGKNITILKQNTTPITVPVTINHLSTLKGAVDVVSKIIARTPVTGLVLDGTLYAGPLSLPISQNLSFLFSNNNSANQQQVSGIGCACAGLGVLN